MLKSFIIFLVFFYIYPTTVFGDKFPIIVISPSKTSQSYGTVGSSVSIIDNQKIKNSGNFFLSDIIDKNLNGMNYFRSGGYGTISGIQIRGLPKRYSTVYIDGVKMSDPSSSDNSFYFSNIMNSSIDRVEILRGSHSSIYGSGAIGGTINIITKEPNQNNIKDLSLKTGSNRTQSIDLSYGKDFGNYNFFVGINKFNTDGISAMNDEKKVNDKDSYENTGLIGKYNFSFNDNYSFKGNFRFSDSLLEYDEVKSGRTDKNNSSDDNELSYSLKLISDFEKFKNTITYNYTNIERATKTYTNLSKNYYGYRDAINYIGEYNFNLDTKIIYGLDNEFDKAKFQKDWPTDYLLSDEAIYSQYLDIQFRPSENLYSTIGFRRDDHTTAGNYNTGRISMAYKLDNFSKIISSYGSGLRYPSLYDYFYGTVIESKEELKPEKSDSFDIGFEKKFQKLNTDISISLFKIKYKDAIEGWESNGWKVQNTNANIESKGIEFSSLWKPKNNINFSLNYNYNKTYDGADCDDPNLGTGNCIDESMVRVPRHSFSSSIDYKYNKKINNKLLLSYTGETRDYGNTNNNFKDVILDDHVIVDYNMNYKIPGNYFLNFNILNMFNNNYEKAYMYSSMGRTMNLSFKRNF